MSGIDELRRTLADHATGITDPGVVGRSAAVHHRVGVVRRRRRAAVAGGALAVVAAAGGLALLPGDGSGPEPADRTVVGVEAPETMLSLDYTYAFDRSIEGDGAAEVTLEAAAEPILVSWATSGDDDHVTVRAGADRRQSASPDFDDFVLIPAGVSERVRVEAAQSDVGLAIYELTDERPEGFTEDGITFRQEIENRTLIGALIGEPGDADITLDVSTPKGGIAYADLCVGAPEGSRVRVGRGSEGYVEAACNDSTTFDPGHDVTSMPNLPASDEPVRVWVVDESGDPVVDPDIRLGIGVYQEPEPTLRVAGQRVPDGIEEGGHEWELGGTAETHREFLRWQVPPPDGPRWVVLYVSGRVEEARPVIDGRPVTSFGNQTGGPAGFGIGPVHAGAEIEVRLHGADPGVVMAIVAYVRED